ncbi:MAG: antitoxin [Pseudomonadota bacterium]|nr:antitoxin [Pseudomonadota bacterium]
MTRKDYKLDLEEQDILDTFNRGEWISKGENLDKYKDAAKQTFTKSHRINFRVSEKDFRSIQIEARKEGIAYQTLVSSVIHKYLSGQMREYS